MSHYCVGVIVKDIEDVDKALAPFYEGLISDRYIYKTKEQVIKDARLELEEEKQKYEFMSNQEECSNTTLKRHNEYLYNEFINLYNKTDEELYQIKKEYQDGEDIDEFGNFTTTYNPNSKWDWYSIGGRWDNYIKTKHGTTCNFAKIKDISFFPDGKTYNDSIRFWEIVVEGENPKDEESIPFTIQAPVYFINRYKTKENYAKQMSRFETFALLYQGTWYERGQMSWFGVDDSTPESLEEYSETFDRIMQEVDPDDYFVIVDCHI